MTRVPFAWNDDTGVDYAEDVDGRLLVDEPTADRLVIATARSLVDVVSPVDLAETIVAMVGAEHRAELPDGRRGFDWTGVILAPMREAAEEELGR